LSQSYRLEADSTLAGDSPAHALLGMMIVIVLFAAQDDRLFQQPAWWASVDMPTMLPAEKV
jgi:hypothetical protein